MRKGVIVSLITILLLIFSVGCGCNKVGVKKETKKDAIKANTNENVIKNQEVEVFKFTNTSLVYEDKTSTLVTQVTNTSDKSEFLKEFKIHVKDEKGNDVIVLTGYVGDNISPKSSTLISTSYADDLTKAYSIEYEIVR
jgi:hypothetical protein